MIKAALKFGVIVGSLDSLSFIIINTKVLKNYIRKMSEKARKPLLDKGLVPRAGLEPARPMLSYPRILSPETETANPTNRQSNSIFERVSGPHCGVTPFIDIHQHQHSDTILNDITERVFSVFGGRERWGII